jgi:2'-5' RNA ligase
MERHRLFVAIDPDEAVIEEIDRYVAAEACVTPHARVAAFKWVARHHYHLTLRFLGATPENRLAAIQTALATMADRSAPIPLVYRGVGVFPPAGMPRVIWIGVEDPTGRLGQLAARVGAALMGFGEPESERKFVPHLTIARATRRSGGFSWGSGFRGESGARSLGRSRGRPDWLNRSARLFRHTLPIHRPGLERKHKRGHPALPSQENKLSSTPPVTPERNLPENLSRCTSHLTLSSRK